MKQNAFKPNTTAGKTTSKGRRFLKIIAILFGAGVLFAGGWYSMGSRINRPKPQSSARQAQSPDYGALIGEWQRSDGGHLLQIRGAGADGRLDCAYYDPMPVEVAHAETIAKGEGIQIFIELQANGYPLAAYQLLYQPGKESLTGLYYRREDGGRYGVSFSKKAP